MQKETGRRLRPDLSQTLKKPFPCILLHPQIHVSGLASNFDQTCVGQLFEMMGERCPGDGNFRPQGNARDFSLFGSDSFQNFKPPAIHEGPRDPKKRPLVHAEIIPYFPQQKMRGWARVSPGFARSCTRKLADRAGRHQKRERLGDMPVARHRSRSVPSLEE